MSVVKQIEQLEAHLVKLDAVIKFGDVVDRFVQSADYREVIEKHFMTEDCANYVQLSQDPSLNAEQQADALNLAQAAGHLKRYISVKIQMANRAEQDKIATQQTIEQLRSMPDDDEEQGDED